MQVGLENQILTKQQRIQAFALLGEHLREYNGDLQQVIRTSTQENSWFTAEYIQSAIDAISYNLTTEKLTTWLTPYPFDGDTDQSVGLILAGNIPLVGFHDILSVLISGFTAQIKLSSTDQALVKHVLNKLISIEPAFDDKIQIVERLRDFDLVIATGSDNSARYFEYYFGQKPHIIRKNRNSIAVLGGEENAADMEALGHDIFDYFGLGCRNISKIFFPKGYEISTFFEGIEQFKDVIHHHKYNNNYDYNKSIYLINGEKHYDNGFILLKPDEKQSSPLAVLFYEEYASTTALAEKLNEQAERFQCVVSNLAIDTVVPVTFFGNSQKPALDDYADGVNTLDFLMGNR